MPIKHAVWLVGDQPTALATTRLVNEQLLEDMIVRDPQILFSEGMNIGPSAVGQDGLFQLECSRLLRPNRTILLLQCNQDVLRLNSNVRTASRWMLHPEASQPSGASDRRHP